jgi:type I restriction enzyme M protein
MPKRSTPNLRRFNKETPLVTLAHGHTRPPYRRPSVVSAGCDRTALLAKDGDALETQYRHTLETVGTHLGMLDVVFRKAQNKIQDAARLRQLVADLLTKTNVLI